MKPVRGGDLRHSVTIQQPSPGAQDATGAFAITWTTALTTRAAIWPIQGREFLIAQQIASKIDMKIRIRYHAGVMSKWRVVWGARTFEIFSVLQPEMRSIYLDLMCYEIKSGATKAAPAMPAPTVTSITPASAVNSAGKAVVIVGTGFLKGAVVTLTKTGQTAITATSVVLASDLSISCTLPITGAAAGAWNVVVTNLDSLAGTLSNGFTVTAA